MLRCILYYRATFEYIKKLHNSNGWRWNVGKKKGSNYSKYNIMGIFLSFWILLRRFTINIFMDCCCWYNPWTSVFINYLFENYKNLTSEIIDDNILIIGIYNVCGMDQLCRQRCGWLTKTIRIHYNSSIGSVSSHCISLGQQFRWHGLWHCHDKKRIWRNGSYCNYGWTYFQCSCRLRTFNYDSAYSKFRYSRQVHIIFAI